MVLSIYLTPFTLRRGIFHLPFTIPLKIMGTQGGYEQERIYGRSDGISLSTNAGHCRQSIHRNVRYIDKQKPRRIINPSYFGEFFNLPIDKIDYRGLK
jgi:hypothetical protein